MIVDLPRQCRLRSWIASERPRSTHGCVGPSRPTPAGSWWPRWWSPCESASRAPQHRCSHLRQAPWWRSCSTRPWKYLARWTKKRKPKNENLLRVGLALNIRFNPVVVADASICKVARSVVHVRPKVCESGLPFVFSISQRHCSFSRSSWEKTKQQKTIFKYICIYVMSEWKRESKETYITLVCVWVLNLCICVCVCLGFKCVCVQVS